MTTKPDGRMDLEAVTSVLRAFEQHGVSYVVFGGAAINLYGYARFTEDLDVFVQGTPSNIEKLKTALKAVYDDPHIDEISAEELLGDYPAVAYFPPSGTFHIDILTRLGEAYRFEDLESQRVDMLDFQITMATPRMLYRMKKDTVRPKDWGDAHLLKVQFNLDEE